MLECFDVYRESLHANLLYALFPETIKLHSWIINFVSPLEAVPECPFQSAVLRALQTANKELSRNFSGGPGAKNLPTNSGDMGLIPGPRRFHMLKGN